MGEKINRLTRVSVIVGSGVVGAGLGLGGIYLAYTQGLLSWASTAETAPLLVLGLGIFGAVGTFMLFWLPSAWSHTSLSAFLGVWLGVSGGVIAPGLAGETAVWEQAPESVVYALDINQVPIDSVVLGATNNPLEGERSTLNYVAPLPTNQFLMVSSAGTEIFDHLESPEFAQGSLRAVFSVWSESLGLVGQADITTFEPSIQLVRGIYFDEPASKLYVSNLPLNSECFGLQLWSLDVDVSKPEITGAEMLYTTEPCLESMTGAERFGGRIVADTDGIVYMSVGDFGYGVSTVREEQLDGAYSSRPDILQAPSSIGSVVAVLSDGSSAVVSRGHRNPQGLYFDSLSGLLWESEHGPKGGDEVNLIEPGNDYGWPDVTYGGPYGGPPQPSGDWDLGRWYGADHGEFTEPIFSWLPSIAASQLLVYQGNAFSGWKGDLLVASFKGNIERLKLDGTRVVLNETIGIDVRPRDMIELNDGTLLITTDSSDFMTIRPGGKN